MLVLASVGLIFMVVYVFIGAPPPMSDDAWFKAPAAELATHGRLASPSLKGLLPRTQEIFACYPPIYVLVISAAYALFGVSLRVSVATVMLLHLVGTTLMALITRRSLRGLGHSRQVAWVASLIAGLIWMSGERLFDRPESLALIFVALDLLLPPSRSTARRSVMSGLLIGLALLTAPWAGIVGAVALLARTVATWWLDEGNNHLPKLGSKLIREAGPAGFISTALFAGWIGWLEVYWPGVFGDQFLGAMKLARFYEPYPSSLVAWGGALTRSLAAQGWLILPVVLAALGAPLILFRSDAMRDSRSRAGLAFALALYTTGVGTLLIASVYRPWAYTYAWGSIFILFPSIGVILVRFLQDADHPWMGRLMIGVLIVLAWTGPARAVYAWSMDDPSHRVDESFARIQFEVPAGEVVGVTSRHWTAFHGRNPWRDALFLYKADPALLDDVHWLVLSEGEGSDRPEQLLPDFELVRSAPSTQRSSLSYGYSIWRRVEHQ
ncbi:MAG: hypothetical protein EA397_20230 [Deltaproteobacteria bacterium]|nr:MAG: hypothetical protein EA397_20230 [Deltaproteobacteria bacterium]